MVIGHELRDDVDLQEALKVGSKKGIFSKYSIYSKTEVTTQKSFQQTYSENLVYSDTGFDHIVCKQDENKTQVRQMPRPLKTIFILDNFDGSIYKQLLKHNCTILGPPVIMKSVSLKVARALFPKFRQIQIFLKSSAFKSTHSTIPPILPILHHYLPLGRPRRATRCLCRPRVDLSTTLPWTRSRCASMDSRKRRRL